MAVLVHVDDIAEGDLQATLLGLVGADLGVDDDELVFVLEACRETASVGGRGGAVAAFEGELKTLGGFAGFDDAGGRVRPARAGTTQPCNRNSARGSIRKAVPPSTPRSLLA